MPTTAVIRANAELTMCDRCTELDERLRRYRKISDSINDQLTIDRIKGMIDDLEAQKVALHPEQKK